MIKLQNEKKKSLKPKKKYYNETVGANCICKVIYLPVEIYLFLKFFDVNMINEIIHCLK